MATAPRRRHHQRQRAGFGRVATGIAPGAHLIVLKALDATATASRAP
jgi:hypothetical protein